MRTRIKICCIASTEEAQLAIRYGADALGLVGEMPSGPGPIEDKLIAHICRTIPPPIGSFLLTSHQSADQIIDHVKRTGTNTVQIVDDLTEGLHLDIKAALPNLKIVQVIHVADERSIEDAIGVSMYVDALLLDSGNPKAEIKVLGGTGTTHNWKISRELVKAVGVPVFLAGGLNSFNVKEAIEIVKPFGVDICNGVRTNGNLDPLKLAAFIAAVRSTDYASDM